MKSANRLRIALMVAALLGPGIATPATAESVATVSSSGRNAPPAVSWAGTPANPADAVTLRDIAESNAKVKMAYGALIAMWSSHFEELDASFEVPQLLRYRGNVRSSCGVMPQGNAAYCPGRNAIYFDEIFLARMAKRVGAELGTDGDMAAVGVIAHEVGHAVATQLGYASRFTYDNEATADCLAGAFARQSQYDGSLEKGDLEEAFLGMALAGDPEPEPTAGDRSDERQRALRALMGHGTRSQRMQNFRAGLAGGPAACLPAFES